MKHWIGISWIIALFLVFIGGMSLAQSPTLEPVPTPEALHVESIIDPAFSYQGRLLTKGKPANGVYDFQFRLFATPSGGSQVGSKIVKEDVLVTNGLFNVVLDFGPRAFTGESRWLQVEVRPGASTGNYIVLVPRQPILAAPYALSLRPGAIIEGDMGDVRINYRSRFTTNPPMYVTYGLYAKANSDASNNWAYGVFGEVEDAKGFGGYFRNNTRGGAALYARSGSDSAPDLILGGNSDNDDNGVIASEPGDKDSDIVIRTNDNLRIDLDADQSGGDADFEIRNRLGRTIFNVDESGAVYSFGATEIAVSPMNMVPDWRYENNIDIRVGADGVVIIRPRKTGRAVAYLPVTLPNVIFGTRKKLFSAEVCYKCSNENSYIHKLEVGQTDNWGRYQRHLDQEYGLKKTSWYCQTLWSSFIGIPSKYITGTLFISFIFEFEGTGEDHEIRIGKITMRIGGR